MKFCKKATMKSLETNKYGGFIVLIMGVAQDTELPNEQPRSTNSFPKTAYFIINKIVNLKENVVQKSQASP